MGSVKALRKRYENALASGDYYTAEQACRTISYRLRTSKKEELTTAHANARSMLHEGSSAILKHGQVHSGAALAVELVKDMRNDGLAFVAAKEDLCDLILEFQDKSPEGLAEKLKFLKACIDYSKKEPLGERTHGDELFNTMAAETLVDMRNYEAAMPYFLRSNAPESCGRMIHEQYGSDGATAGVNQLALSMTVLNYAVSENLGDGRIVLETFRRMADLQDRVISVQINFCDMLLKILQRRDAHPLLQKLKNAYDDLIKLSPSLEKNMDLLGDIYFGVKPPRSANSMVQDMMSEVMKSFFGNTEASARRGR